MRRIGIFAGSFDPVHKGHIGFALAAKRSANLDAVYFLPEIQPRNKAGVTHVSHRVAMLNLAVKPHRSLHVLSLPDRHFSVKSTLPRLRKHFPRSELLLLLGSDVFLGVPDWPYNASLLKQVGLIVGVRANSGIVAALQLVNELKQPLKELHIVESTEPAVSSRQIRRATMRGRHAPGELASVQSYIAHNWLYSSPGIS